MKLPDETGYKFENYFTKFNRILCCQPKIFTGKSLRQLDIRTKYGIEVLSVKTREKGEEKIKAIPGSDYIIKESDILVIAGEIKNINIIRNIP